MQYNWPLIGHENVKRYFEKALNAGRLHHAYLFEGPSRVGKATFARLLAKTLLCEGDTRLPCGLCRACTAFEHSAHPDYLALDRGEKESISIESAREFISALATRPLLSSFRIGIIEEAAALTAEASSVLLKTTEEPSLTVVLFLIADQPVLTTVASRCQRIRFGFVPAASLEKSLAGLEHALLIALAAAGCPGKALALSENGAYEAYLSQRQEVVDVLGRKEGERMLWIAERFAGKGESSAKREALRDFLVMLQQTLRERLVADQGTARLLRRTFEAQEYLRANVDPKLICEYLLL